MCSLSVFFYKGQILFFIGFLCVHSAWKRHLRNDLHGGPKNWTCLSVDNSAMVSGKSRVIRQKFQNGVKNK